MIQNYLRQIGDKVYFVSLSKEVTLAEVEKIAQELTSLTAAFPAKTIILCFDVRQVRSLGFSTLTQLLSAGIEGAVHDLHTLIQLGGSTIPLVGFVANQLTRRKGINYKSFITPVQCYNYLTEEIGLSASDIGAQDSEQFSSRINRLSGYGVKVS